MATARPKTLRSVKPQESAPSRPERLSVAQAAASGIHRNLLVAMRERIAQAVSDPDCPPRDLAALTRRLQDIAKEIEVIDTRAIEDGEVGADIEDGTFDASAV